MSPVGVNPVCADLLLLPGLNNTGAVFDGVVAHLPASLRVHCPDLPALDRVEALADAVLADAPERFWLGGFSFGGYVAMAVLERAPERVQGIALICSTPRAGTPLQATKRREAIAVARAGGYEAMASTATAPFHPASLDRPDLLERRRAIVHDYGAERFIAHTEAVMARPDRSALLDGTRPTLWITSSHDAILPSKRLAAEASGVPGCEFICIDGAGHLLPLELPHALADVLARWITTDSAPSAHTQETP